jgi:DNA-binding NtrC family response regulator
LDLSDVQKEMVPGARAAIAKVLTLDQAREAFTLTLIDVAIEASGGVQSHAARRLGVNPSLVSQAVTGRTYSRFRKNKKQDQEPK